MFTNKPNNKKKQSGWDTLRKRFQPKKKLNVQKDSVDYNYPSSGSLNSLYDETTNAASDIISESSSTSHSTDENSSADYHSMPNNKKKQSGWDTLRKRFQPKKKLNVQKDSVDYNYPSSGSLNSLYDETTNAASDIISKSSSTTSHSMDEAFSANVCPIKARPLPPIPLDTDENSKDKSSSVINLNDREIFAKMSSNKLKITECEAELAYKLFLAMFSYYAPDRENDADIILKELFDRYKEYVDRDIYEKILNSQRNSTDSPRYQNFSVFFRQDSITSTAQTQNESTPEKTEDTTSEHLYMPMQPIYMVMQPQSSEQIQNIRGRANTI